MSKPEVFTHGGWEFRRNDDGIWVHRKSYRVELGGADQ